jgi:aminopeptidase
MTDPRYQKLARLLVQYSTGLQKGDRVLLDMIDVPDEFSIELMRAARGAGALPIVEARHTRLTRELLRETNEAHAALVRELMRAARAAGATPIIEVRHTRINREVLRATNHPHARLVRDLELFRMKKMQAYIAVRGSANATENADVASDRLGLYSRTTRPVLNYRVSKTRWCVLRWPTPSMAQAAGMSTEAFENLYFDVCTLDYRKMARAMIPLERRMRKADRVRITSPGTDLAFSIKGIGAKMCKGDRNIPDGEVFSCPVRDSINGRIQFNTPTLYSGTKFENVCLEFKDGKVVQAVSNNTRRLNEILDTDPGARYTGEFSLGFNPYILSPMCDILFDEKIAGSLHLTPGQAYEECDNGNRSAVHWDMVLIQRPEWGGGEVWFDGELIRKNGLFVPRDLKPLNPANLS